jgi:hypothetical protein
MKRYAREESMFVVFIAAVVPFVAVFPNGAEPSQRPLNEGTDIGGRAIVMSFVALTLPRTGRLLQGFR